MPLQVAKQDISKPTQRMLTHIRWRVRWAIEFYNKKTGQGKISLIQNRILELLPVPKKYRFNGRTQLFFASQPKRMYVTSQVVHVTEDQGHSFEIISPDLSRNDKNYRRNRRTNHKGSNWSRSICKCMPLPLPSATSLPVYT
jgi:hypothetical protein